MSFPQLNQSQVATLSEMSNGTGAFVQAVPDPKKDLAATYIEAMEAVRDNEQLVILGLIKEITDQCGEKLSEMYAATGHLARVFQITEIGQKMFEGSKSSTVH
jgi:hypothetical protein